MIYDDLPFRYRTYAEDKDWENDQALSFFLGAREYRAFVEAEVLACCRQEVLNNRLEGVHAVDDILKKIRGSGFMLS